MSSTPASAKAYKSIGGNEEPVGRHDPLWPVKGLVATILTWASVSVKCPWVGQGPNPSVHSIATVLPLDVGVLDVHTLSPNLSGNYPIPTGIGQRGLLRQTRNS